MSNQKVLRSCTLPLGGYQQIFDTTGEGNQSFHCGASIALFEFFVDICADDGKMTREAVAVVNTMKSFNKHWATLSIDNLPKGSIIHLFRFGGSPCSTHKSNKDGSQIRIVFKDSPTIFRLWYDLAAHLVGCKDQDVVQNVNGVSCHPSSFLVKIWLGSNQEITKDLMLKSLATMIPDRAELTWRTPQDYELGTPIVTVSPFCSFTGNSLSMDTVKRRRSNSCPELFQYEFEIQIAETKITRACTTTIELTSELHGKSFNNCDGTPNRMPSALQVTKKGFTDGGSAADLRKVWSAGDFDDYLPSLPLERPDMGGGLKKVVSCDSLEDDDELPALDGTDPPPPVFPNSNSCLAVGGEKSSARPYRVATYDGGFFSLPDVMPAIRPQLSTRSLPPAAAPPKEDRLEMTPEKLKIDLNAVLKYLQRTRNLCVSFIPEETIVDDIKFSKSRSPRNRRKIRERKIREAAAMAKKEMQVWGPMYNQPITSWIDPICNCTIDKPDDIQEDEWFRLVQAHRKDLVSMDTLNTLADDVLNTLGITDEAVRTIIKAAEITKLPDPNPLDAIIAEMKHNEVPCYVYETQQLSPSMSASTKSPVRSPITGDLPAPARIVTTQPPRDITIPL